jgi:hypothetical protein
VLLFDVKSRHWWRSNRAAAVLLLFVDQVIWKSLTVALRWLDGAQLVRAASGLSMRRHWGECEGGLAWSRGRNQERRYRETGTQTNGDAFGRPFLPHQSMIRRKDFFEQS